MTQEDKELLLKDLCGRLPYRVKVALGDKPMYVWSLESVSVDKDGVIDVYIESGNFPLEAVKPYLRPLKSITEEEYKELNEVYNNGESHHVVLPQNDEQHHATLCMISNGTIDDWLNSHHFDYRGLIEKGLALEATEGIYKIGKQYTCCPQK